METCTWRPADEADDIFPATADEFRKMRVLWPNAWGPESEEQLSSCPTTPCCNAGKVGQIVEEKWGRTGYLYCWHCGQRAGTY